MSKPLELLEEALRQNARLIEMLEAAQMDQAARREQWRNEKRQQRTNVQQKSGRQSNGQTPDIPPDNGENHIGEGPTYPPGGDTSSLTSSSPVVVTFPPPCNPSPSTARSVSEGAGSRVFAAYQAAIQPKARLIDAARTKIASRLRVFSEAELLEAVRRFAADSWEMEHNASRGAAWFFDSDKRIEGYVNLAPRTGGNGVKHLDLSGLEEWSRQMDELEAAR